MLERCTIRSMVYSAGVQSGGRGQKCVAERIEHFDAVCISNTLVKQGGVLGISYTVECLLFGLSKRYYGSFSALELLDSTNGHPSRTIHNSTNKTFPSKFRIRVAALEYLSPTLIRTKVQHVIFSGLATEL